VAGEKQNLWHRGLQEHRGDRNAGEMWARFWLNSTYLARLGTLLATVMSTLHFHAAAFAVHLPTAGMLGRSHLGGRQCTCHRWRK
jgi:hypothetical protein